MSEKQFDNVKTNITLKTLWRVRDCVVWAEKPVSKNYIAKQEGLHPERVEVALQELLKQGKIKQLQNSTGVCLYVGKG